MGKIYTVVLNSAIANDASLNSERFFFDWSQFEEGRYECCFTFVGGVGTTAPTFLTVPNLFVDLGQGPYTNIASSNVPTNTTIGATFSAMYIGALETRTLTTTGGSSTYYIAGTTTNPPFYLDSRPRNNSITVMMLANNGNQGTAYVPVSGPYTLTLQFKMLD